MPPGIARTRSTTTGSCHARAEPARTVVPPADAIPPGDLEGRLPSLYFVPVADLPLTLPTEASAALLAAIDRERKIDRALEALGPIADRDVAVIGGGRLELVRLVAAGARVTELSVGESRWPAADASADVIVSAWSAFRGVSAGDLAEVDRILRPDGRVIVIHDYGRDDVSRLRGDLPEYGIWSRRDGPFIRNGFRIRVLHCFWTFDTAEDTARFLAQAFGEVGRALAGELKRPRLSYNVAVYHRTRGGRAAPAVAHSEGQTTQS
jgi:SAM-dependent methyltransferase